jgi:hypothetical protein
LSTVFFTTHYLSLSLFLLIDVDDTSRRTIPENALSPHEYSSTHLVTKNEMCDSCEREIIATTYIFEQQSHGSWQCFDVHSPLPLQLRHTRTPPSPQNDTAVYADDGVAAAETKCKNLCQSTTPPNQNNNHTPNTPVRRASVRCEAWKAGKAKGKRGNGGYYDLAVCISEFLPSPHNNRGGKERVAVETRGGSFSFTASSVLMMIVTDRRKKNKISSHLGRRRAIPNRGFLLPPLHDSLSARQHHVEV